MLESNFNFFKSSGWSADTFLTNCFLVETESRLQHLYWKVKGRKMVRFIHNSNMKKWNSWSTNLTKIEFWWISCTLERVAILLGVWVWLSFCIVAWFKFLWLSICLSWAETTQTSFLSLLLMIESLRECPRTLKFHQTPTMFQSSEKLWTGSWSRWWRRWGWGTSWAWPPRSRWGWRTRWSTQTLRICKRIGW